MNPSLNHRSCWGLYLLAQTVFCKVNLLFQVFDPHHVLHSLTAFFFCGTSASKSCDDHEDEQTAPS